MASGQDILIDNSDDDGKYSVLGSRSTLKQTSEIGFGDVCCIFNKVKTCDHCDDNCDDSDVKTWDHCDDNCDYNDVRTCD